MRKVSSTYRSHNWGGARTDGLNFKLFHEQVTMERANKGTCGCTMDLFKILTLEEEVDIFKAKLQQGDGLGN